MPLGVTVELRSATNGLFNDRKLPNETNCRISPQTLSIKTVIMLFSKHFCVVNTHIWVSFFLNFLYVDSTHTVPRFLVSNCTILMLDQLGAQHQYCALFKRKLHTVCKHVLWFSMSKQTKSAAVISTTTAASVDVFPCLVCKDTFVTEIQAIIMSNNGVLTAENKTILEALPLLDAKGLVKILFNLMTEKQDASIQGGVRFSPQRAPIVTISKDGSFKKIVNPVDEHFFDDYKEFLDGVATPEWWQHFSGSLMFDSNGRFGCVVCEVEAVPSANKFSLVCPRRNQHGDMKVQPLNLNSSNPPNLIPPTQQAQSKGCFATIKIKLAECVAMHQDAVIRYNASKVKTVTSKSTDSLMRELLSSRKRPTPEE
jgi:hypothetical protein